MENNMKDPKALNKDGDEKNDDKKDDEKKDEKESKKDDDKKDSENVDVEAHTIAAYTDEDGNDVAEEDVATTYVQTHFMGQDDTKDARLLADEWTRIRRERTRLLTETDYLALSDQTLSAGMTTYRQELRDLPDDQSSETAYADITWPDKP